MLFEADFKANTLIFKENFTERLVISVNKTIFHIYFCLHIFREI